MICCITCVIFFIKQKTAYDMRISDWSSDVCSSDLPVAEIVVGLERALAEQGIVQNLLGFGAALFFVDYLHARAPLRIMSSVIRLSGILRSTLGAGGGA